MCAWHCAAKRECCLASGKTIWDKPVLSVEVKSEEVADMTKSEGGNLLTDSILTPQESLFK